MMNMLARFHKYTNTNDPVIKNGLPVRVTYLITDSSIQKLEIGKEQ